MPKREIVGIIEYVLSLMLYYISYHFQIVFAELTWVLKTIPYVCQAFLCMPSSEDNVYRVHSEDKVEYANMSVNQAHSVNEGKMDGTKC